MASELETAIYALLYVAGIYLPWLEVDNLEAFRKESSTKRQEALYCQAKLAWLSGWTVTVPQVLAAPSTPSCCMHVDQYNGRKQVKGKS